MCARCRYYASRLTQSSSGEALRTVLYDVLYAIILIHGERRCAGNNREKQPPTENVATKKLRARRIFANSARTSRNVGIFFFTDDNSASCHNRGGYYYYVHPPHSVTTTRVCRGGRGKNAYRENSENTVQRFRRGAQYKTTVFAFGEPRRTFCVLNICGGP